MVCLPNGNMDEYGHWWVKQGRLARGSRSSPLPGCHAVEWRRVR